jgi:hypothetical protein
LDYVPDFIDVSFFGFVFVLKTVARIGFEPGGGRVEVLDPNRCTGAPGTKTTADAILIIGIKREKNMADPEKNLYHSSPEMLKAVAKALLRQEVRSQGGVLGADHVLQVDYIQNPCGHGAYASWEEYFCYVFRNLAGGQFVHLGQTVRAQKLDNVRDEVEWSSNLQNCWESKVLKEDE